LRSVDFIGDFFSRQIPLSPPAEKQTVTKPTKFNNLVGFTFSAISNYSIVNLKGFLFQTSIHKALQPVQQPV